MRLCLSRSNMTHTNGPSSWSILSSRRFLRVMGSTTWRFRWTLKMSRKNCLKPSTYHSLTPEPVQIEVQVEIDRRPDAVWPILVNVERWPEWTPSVTAVERLDQSAFGLGS